jgi:RNA polymerase I-specific transcription initiation factor RRN5
MNNVSPSSGRAICSPGRHNLQHSGDETEMAAAPLGQNRPRKRRAPLKPLPGYVAMYNAHVREFFGDQKPSGLKPLMVSADGLKYGGPDNTPGTWWSSGEKHKFFRLLSRYSIHCVDMILAALETKSELEILAYYHILQTSLQKIRRSLKSAHYKVLVPRRRTRQNFRLDVHVPKLILYRDMPIAYEMTDAFTSIEDRQALILTQGERKRINDENRRFQRHFDTYTSSASEDAPDGDSGMVHNGGAAAGSADSCLLNLDVALRISQHVSETVEHDTVPRLHLKSFALLEELARIYTHKILVDVATKKIQNRWVMARNTESPSSVTRIDIERAVEQWKRVPSVTFTPFQSEAPISTIPHIEQLTQSRPQTSWDELIEEQVDMLVESYLDEKDGWESRSHEHVMLTFLSSYGKQEERGKDEEKKDKETNGKEKEIEDMKESPDNFDSTSDSDSDSGFESAESDFQSDSSSDSGSESSSDSGSESGSDSDTSVISEPTVDHYEIPNQLILDHSKVFSRYDT